jgi:hypothetical protein
VAKIKILQPLPGLEHPITQHIAQRCTTELTRLLKELGSNEFTKTPEVLVLL